MKLLLTLTLFASAALSAAQSKIGYSYDNNGNRTSRHIIPGIVKKNTVTNLDTVPSSDSLLVFETESENPPAESAVDQNRNPVSHFIIAKHGINIYPNPTRGLLSIGLTNFGPVDKIALEIIDPNGRTIVNSQSSQSFYSFDLSNYAAGNYSVNLTVNGEVGRFRVVKE